MFFLGHWVQKCMSKYINKFKTYVYHEQIGIGIDKFGHAILNSAMAINITKMFTLLEQIIVAFSPLEWTMWNIKINYIDSWNSKIIYWFIFNMWKSGIVLLEDLSDRFIWCPLVWALTIFLDCSSNAPLSMMDHFSGSAYLRSSCPGYH